MYDITNRKSFENLQKTLETAKQAVNGNVSFVIVGNKMDMTDERVVTYEEGKKWADERGYSFFEISCKSGEHVNDVFEDLVDEIVTNGNF